jgi:hypothetical protein
MEHNIGSQEIFRQQLAKIAENSDHNIATW